MLVRLFYLHIFASVRSTVGKLIVLVANWMQLYLLHDFMPSGYAVCCPVLIHRWLSVLPDGIGRTCYLAPFLFLPKPPTQAVAVVLFLSPQGKLSDPLIGSIGCSVSEWFLCTWVISSDYGR